MRVRKIRNFGAIYVFIMAFLTMTFLPELTGIQISTLVEPKTARAAVPTAALPMREELEPVYNHWKVKKQKCSYPGKLYRGVGFIVKGTLISSRPLTCALGMIQSEEGKVLYEDRVTVEKDRVNLNEMDEALLFSRLDEGSYRYVVLLYDKEHCNKVIDREFQVEKQDWAWPVYGGVKGDGWCCECSAHHGRHYGVDIKGPGQPIHATADGTVVYAKYHESNGLGSFGRLLILYHGGGIYSYYAHCSTHYVKAGDKVKQGDTVATVGATGRAFGPHLHFELRRGPVFQGGYNSDKLVDKQIYVQFNPLKKGYLKAGSH